VPSDAPTSERGATAVAAADLPRPFRVAARRRETRDTFTLDLEPADGGPAIAFRPGQFNMVWTFGVGEVPLSISGDPGRIAPLRHTVRAVGTVTRALARLRAGDAVGVRGPFGSPWPTAELAGQDVVLVAGGIGLAPLRPVIEHLLAGRARFGRIVLAYGARSPADLLFRRDLARWGRAAEVLVTVDRAAPSWRGDVGVVTAALRRASFDPASAVALTCGPEIMMRFAAKELLRRGMAPERVWLSMERNMKCGVGSCGHCQYGPDFVCRDGPVFRYDRVAGRLGVREA